MTARFAPDRFSREQEGCRRKIRKVTEIKEPRRRITKGSEVDRRGILMRVRATQDPVPWITHNVFTILFLKLARGASIRGDTSGSFNPRPRLFIAGIAKRSRQVDWQAIDRKDQLRVDDGDDTGCTLGASPCSAVALTTAAPRACVPFCRKRDGEEAIEQEEASEPRGRSETEAGRNEGEGERERRVGQGGRRERVGR